MTCISAAKFSTTTKMKTLIFYLLLVFHPIRISKQDEIEIKVDDHQHSQMISNEPSSSFSFDDSTLYRINWLDPNDSDGSNGGKNGTHGRQDVPGEEIILTTETQDKYRCFIPKIEEKNKSGGNDSKKQDDLNPYQLLKPLFARQLCSYRVDNYWTYELCHGKYIRQFHEDPGLKGPVQEFILGTFDMESFQRYEKLYEETIQQKNPDQQQQRLPVVNVEDQQLPYVAVNMTDGTLCDLSGKKRITKILYVCFDGGKHELYSVKETTTCEYEVIAFSSLLCLSPKFKLETSVEHDIDCYAIDSAPPIPKGYELDAIEREQKLSKANKRNTGVGGGGSLSESSFMETKTIMIDAFSNGKEVHINFITEPDESTSHETSLWTSHSHIISKFLKGEYCLTGGSGWWKYEFCYGKMVNQYHEERGNEKRQIINLGRWNLEEHLAWIKNNPGRKPKSGKTPKQVWHYYTDGDYCEQAKKPRTVEVKLKCRNDLNNPDSVAIYLMEPKTCDYILGVESPIICDLLSTVDENGMFQFTEQDE